MPARVAHNEWTSEASTLGAAWLPRLGDERLAWLAARGNTRAFAAVYQRYHQSLYRYCRSILRDDTDAQDALQSTFTRALSALQRDQRSAPLRPWLFRIAHNESISVLRRRRGGGGSDPLDEGSIPLAPSAEDQAGDRARLGVLMGDLAALPDRARNALVMRELSGLSHEDIAIALGISQGAAKQAIFEARRGLQECAEGRAMACAEVCQAISDGDRRVLRGRRVRAHVRDCTSCAAFAAAMQTRSAELRALVPVLPAAASAAVLSRVIQAGAGHGAVAGGGAAVAGTAGKTVGIAIGSKGFAAASVLATAAVSVGGVAAVVRLSHDGRPAVAGGSHATTARPVVHHASALGGSPAAAAVRAALGTTSGARATAGLELPARTTVTRGHRRSAWPHGRSASSHAQSGSSAPGQSGSLSPGHSGSSAHGQSGSFSPGHSGSSHGKSASSPGHSRTSSHGHHASSPGHSAASHGKSASSPGHKGSSHGNSASSTGSSAASNGERPAEGPPGAPGGAKQTAPGQLKKSIAAAEQSATAQTNQGLGAVNGVATDVSGSPTLIPGKAHK